MKRIYLSPPHMSGFEQEFVADAFASNWIAPLGPHVDNFEKEMCAYNKCTAAAALSSGTAAIHIALRLCGVGAGDVVFCSSLTFVGSANPIVYQGATPVFIDSEPDSWNMSPRALERALLDAEKQGKLPKAVVVVNLYGQSADYGGLLPICGKYSVPVIEDAAESLGATWQGKLSGTAGKFGIFSFNGNKILNTSGGGMLISDDAAAIEKARFLATQARDPAAHYQHSEIGYNYRMSNIIAAIGRGQLRVLDERIAQKRTVFDRYYTALSGFPGLTFMPEADFGRGNRWLSVMTVNPLLCNGVTPRDLIAALETENIESRPLWKPMHRQPVYSGCSYYAHEENISVSDALFESSICLPSGTNMSDEDQGRVIECVVETIRRGK